tara:strand:+ start:1238 stop:2161 length:924 start_codon:yes stop_codon:yes gene_type:complete
MKVVYGHTDSIYVKIDSVEKAQSICEEVNEHVQGLFPNVLGLDYHPVQLEFEKYYKTLGVGCVRNRNAGFISWKDGFFLDEPEFVVTGFTMKRISETGLEKEVQKTAIEMWVNECDENELVKYVKNTFNDVKKGNVPLEKITKRTRLKENRLKLKHICGKEYNMMELVDMYNRTGLLESGNDKLKCKCNKNLEKTLFKTLEGKNITIGSGIAGLIYYNQTHKENIDDSYLFLKCQPNGRRFIDPFGESKPVTYVSVREQSEFNGYIPDYNFYAETVIKKAKPVFEAMGWNVGQCREDNTQSVLDDWW